MKRIASFEVDHTKINKGIYISRIDGSITTYDLRMKLPNSDDYLENDGIHSFEHLFATFVRNSQYSENIVYVGPMGCLTGFYFLTSNLDHESAVKLIIASLEFIAAYISDIPGVSVVECGNYKLHSLEKAKSYAADFRAAILKNGDTLSAY